MTTFGITFMIECMRCTIGFWRSSPRRSPGLVVQLRAFSAAESGLWDGAGGDDDKTRKLLNSICAFAGVTPLPLTLPEKVS